MLIDSVGVGKWEHAEVIFNFLNIALGYIIATSALFGFIDLTEHLMQSIFYQLFQIKYLQKEQVGGSSEHKLHLFLGPPA